jgi:plastocyanin
VMSPSPDSTTATGGTSAAPAATVTTTTTGGTAGTGPLTVEITIRIDIDQSDTGVTVPVTVMPGTAPVAGPAAPRDAPESPALGPAPTASTQNAPAATGTAVTISNMAFSPATVTIPLGTKVTWTNTDPVAHTVTAVGGAFNSGHLNPGQTFSYTFDKAGTFDYACTYHPYMKGTITVQ